MYAFRAEENHIQPNYSAVEPSPKGFIYKKTLVPKAGSLDIYVLFGIHKEARKLVIERDFKGMKDRTQ